MRYVDRHVLSFWLRADGDAYYARGKGTDSPLLKIAIRRLRAADELDAWDGESEIDEVSLDQILLACKVLGIDDAIFQRVAR